MRISVDLWGTLIKSSPQFHKAKIDLVAEYFKIGESKTIDSFSFVKKFLNSIIEREGYQPEKSDILNFLCRNFDPAGNFEGSYQDFYEDYQELAIKYPPVPWDSDTMTCLYLLSKDHELVLSSNTLLINGDSLTKILHDNGISVFFDKMNFSDQMCCAKPNAKMYDSSEIHIGDNPITDGVGAVNAGCKSIIVNSNGISLREAIKNI